MLLKEIYIILTHIITNSIFNFPDELKMADVTPTIKTDDLLYHERFKRT